MRAPTFTSPLHDERAATLLGIALGVAFTTCFATGLVSHFAYEQPGWWPLGPRPAGLYRVTQGVHVATGLAAVPLLLVKLWVVYPSFWTWPPARSVRHAFERISLVPLVGGSLFLLFSGVGNILRWRPWGFFFTEAHYAAAWIAIGGLLVHVGAKWATATDVLRHPAPDVPPSLHVSRRQLLGSAALASAALPAATVGQTIRPLSFLAVLAPRDPRVGPQGLPVNRTAAGAGVAALVRDGRFPERYRLEVEDGRRTVRLGLADLRAMRPTTASLPIACVEGWSATGIWTGVAVRDLLRELGAGDVGRVEVVSLEERGLYKRSRLTRSWIDDPHTLLAYDLGGEPLHVEHGFPLRLIAPNRPGVLQTKWVGRLVLP